MDRFIEILYNVLSTNIGFMLLLIAAIALGVYNTKKYVINRNETIREEIANEKKYPILRLLNILWLIALLVGAPYFLTAFSEQTDKPQFVSKICTGMLPRVAECVNLTSQQCPDLVAKQLGDCFESLPNDSLFQTSADREKLNLARRQCFKASMIKVLTENYTTDNTPFCRQLIESRVYEYGT
jgi:hypothetical protein